MTLRKEGSSILIIQVLGNGYDYVQNGMRWKGLEESALCCIFLKKFKNVNVLILK